MADQGADQRGRPDEEAAVFAATATTAADKAGELEDSLIEAFGTTARR